MGSLNPEIRARSDQPGNEPPALVEKFIRDLDALRPDPFPIKKPGQDFLRVRDVVGKSECDLLHLSVQQVKGQRLEVPVDVAGLAPISGYGPNDIPSS